jgi:hypothetical protein
VLSGQMRGVRTVPASMQAANAPGTMWLQILSPEFLRGAAHWHASPLHCVLIAPQALFGHD